MERLDTMRGWSDEAVRQYYDKDLDQATTKVREAFETYYEQGSFTREELAISLLQWDLNVEEALGGGRHLCIWEEWW